MRAVYRIVKDTVERIWIEDMCDRFNCPTVTNDAENVIKDLLEKNLISVGKRVYYTDSEGRVGELCHDGRVFTGFAPNDKSPTI